jgi:uncharacterized small protein (DUF1192 family)
MIDKVLLSLRPNAKWILREDTIEWLDTEQTQPTDAEIQAEIVRLKTEDTAKQYQRDRASAYASLAEQLDMQYWDKINGTEIWLNHIKEVKAKYPKGF